MEKKEEYKTLIIEGTKYTTLLSKKFEHRKNWEKPDPKMIKSYIPGTIVELFIKEGQSVNAGQELLILEAMKMLNKVTAPVKGKIKKLHVKNGDIIPKDFLILEIE